METRRTPGAIDRSSPLPLCAQIAAASSPSAAETRFCGDEKVAARFDAGRVTARHAFKQLAGEGLLRRVKGIGTFVAAGKIEERALARFFDGAARGDRPMTARVPTMSTGPRAANRNRGVH